jgi:hypothetical protein
MIMSDRNDILKNKYEINDRIKIFSMSETLKEMKPNEEPPTKKINIVTKRRLTDREIIMCKSVFKDSIDYKKIWIVQRGFGMSFQGNAITLGYSITLPREEYENTPDFSKTEFAELKHWFMHEITHVWQNALGFKGMPKVKRVCRGEYFKMVDSPDASDGTDLAPYATDLRGRDLYKKFNKFNYEQQGRIIEFYFDAKFLKNDNPKRKHHQNSLKFEPYVLFALEEFLKNPSDKSQLPTR